jgi:hypothetical protein
MMKSIFLTENPPGENEKPLSGFTVLIAVFCLLNLGLNLYNHRFNVSDFRVFYMASENMVSGEPVYEHPFVLASGYYKYSPVTLFYFAYFSLLPFKTAAVLHLLILSLCYWYLFMLVRKMLREHFFQDPIRREGQLLSLAAACTMIHMVRELYLGNINILLIVLCLVALDLVLHKRFLGAGVLLGVVVLFKPFFLILALPLLLRKNFKSLAGMLVAMAAGLALPFLVLGYSKARILTSGWLQNIARHDREFPGVHTIDNFLRHNFFPGLPPYAIYIILLAAALAAAIFILVNKREEQKFRKRRNLVNQHIIFEGFLLLAVIPCLVKTDSEHFLASAPIITFLVYSVAVKGKNQLIPVMIFLMFFFGANSTDLLGRGLSERLYNMGLLGFSNLCLIILAVIIFPGWRKYKSEIANE